MGTQVRADGIPPLQGRHMIVCLGGYNDGIFDLVLNRTRFFVPFVENTVDRVWMACG